MYDFNHYICIIRNEVITIKRYTIMATKKDMGMKYDIIILLSYFDGEYTRGRNKIDN